MNDVADWLERQQHAPEDTSGLTMMDLLDLPPAVRALARLLLRKGAMSYQDLAAAAAAHPEAERLSDAQLDAVIETLSRQCWLQRVESAEILLFRLHLRRKAPSSPSVPPLPGGEL
jgi:hypothetical protein